MPLEMPRRAPVTDSVWLRFWEALKERTGTEDTDYIREDRFTAGSVATSRESRRASKEAAKRAFFEGNPPPDRQTARNTRSIREMRFLEGF